MAKKKASVAKQASAAGSRRAALRAQQLAAAKKARRNRILIAIACVVALALVVGLVIWAINRKPADTTPSPTDTAPTTAPASSSAPAPTAPQVVPPDGNSKDIAQAAWITVPSANTKPDALAVAIHTDYQCPYCELVETSYGTLFEQLNDQGDIILRQHTRAFLDGVAGETLGSSTRAAVAAACVDVADRTKYAAYHNAIFANQPTEGVGFTDDQLRNTFAATAGLTGDALATFQSCYDGRATATWVANAEKNNYTAVENPDGSPKYLFGGDVASCYTQDASGKMTKAECSAEGAFPMGILGTPSFIAGSVTFGLGDLFDTGYKPKFTSAADLLTFLKQKANS